jgi:arylsulfatase A-like enzyme
MDFRHRRITPCLQPAKKEKAMSQWSDKSTLALASLLGLYFVTVPPAALAGAAKPRPNILFIVMDDVGVDQMKVFGYGGLDAPKTPNIDAIAMAGVRFRNTWSMPSCTPSRATFFNGRYPLRTNVLNAVTSSDLANSQVSPYEYTTPRLLKRKGYVSALFGKMHLTGSQLNPANNPYGNDAMRALGWDYFEGYLDGAPYPIDTTAGGVSPVLENGEGVYGCGFVPNRKDDLQYGANQGACYLATGACETLSTADTATPGRACLERGGIFDPNQSCQTPPPDKLNFGKQNGYYTAAWVINREDGSTETVPPSDSRARGYRTAQETDRAIDWIGKHSANQPWMVSLGYSAVHAPLQPPPAALLPQDSANADGYNCQDLVQQRVLGNQMIEAMDHEIGRLLVETGLARRLPDGNLDYQPESTNTVVVIVADNGTYAPSVKPPFDPNRAKGTLYQTGVWVPLIVAGPMVEQPGREVPHMVNSADLYTLFAELGGVNVRKAVPKSHTLDSRKMLSYLTRPGRKSIRSTNYTQMGTNLRASGTRESPCLIESINICTTTFPQAAVCVDQGGTWYGPDGAAGAEGFTSCCALNEYLKSQGKPPSDILPFDQKAIRNDRFKLVQLDSVACNGPDPAPEPATTYEFYEVNEDEPVPELDREEDNLLANGGELAGEQKRNYRDLLKKLGKLEKSVVRCEGDGNLDLVVNNKDLDGWQEFSQLNGGRSSWYDFNLDGLTNEADREIIEKNLGKRCKSGKSAETAP